MCEGKSLKNIKPRKDLLSFLLSKSNSGNVRSIDSKGQVECKNSKETVAILQMRDDDDFDYGIEMGIMWTSHSLGLFHRKNHQNWLID